MELPTEISKLKDRLKPKAIYYYEEIKKRKILVLPVIILILLLITVLSSLSQTEKQKSTDIINSNNSEETIVPVPTGPSVISRAGVFKAVKYGSKMEYFIVLKNGDALKLEMDKSINALPYYDKNVFVTGVLNPEGSIIKVENISRYDAGGEDPKDQGTPIPFPNTSPSPTPTDLPLSSPAGE